MPAYDNIIRGETMSGIWNINSSYNVNTKRMTSKLSFEVGQNFVARIMNLDKLTGDVLLKLLDGWQFSAKLEKGVDISTAGLIKFQVEGFEDGKLQLKLVNTDKKESNTEEDSIDFLLKSKSINVDKEDLPLLSKMVKHEMPLTKENISNMKTIVDFMDKLNQNPEEENAFISKYVESKDISPGSIESQKVKETLKGFFGELKNIGEDDILTLMENNIDLTEENIKSFNNVFKKSGTIYKGIKDINLNKDMENQNVQKSNTQDKEVFSVTANQQEEVLENNNEKIINKSVNTALEEVKENIPSSKDIEKNSETKMENKDEVKNEIDGKVQNKNIASEEAKENTSNKDIEKNNETKGEIKSLVKNENVDNIEKMVKAIKDQISEKTQEMKNIIKTVIEQKSDGKSDVYNNIIQTLDKNMNDFKIFNSVSNSYYYLDLPLNVDKSEYQCKLMIKDERKKGKKIDSTNVKIAASVATNNMGVVDAYIKVSNTNMDIDIKCIGDWVKTLDKGKERIFKELNNIGYNVNVYIDEKKQEMNIVNCREFFEDNNLGVINTRV